MAMVFCRQCGDLVHHKARVCLSCGTAEPAAAPPPAVPAPAARARHGDGLVWVVAFTPVLGVVIESLLAHLVHGSGLDAGQSLAERHYLWATMLLSIALCAWDAQRLRRSGVNTAAFGPAALVPVYLLRRARGLGHRPPAYFIGWVVCACLTVAF